MTLQLDLGEIEINPCRKCGKPPRLTRDEIEGEEVWQIECGSADHYYGLSRGDCAQAIRDWNASLPERGSVA